MCKVLEQSIARIRHTYISKYVAVHCVFPSYVRKLAVILFLTYQSKHINILVTSIISPSRDSIFMSVSENYEALPITFQSLHIGRCLYPQALIGQLRRLRWLPHPRAFALFGV